jgi:hypothetical protein
MKKFKNYIEQRDLQEGNNDRSIERVLDDPDTKRIIIVAAQSLKNVRNIPRDDEKQSRRGFLKWGVGAVSAAIGGGITVYLMQIFGTSLGFNWFKQQQQNIKMGKEIEPPPPEIMNERPDPNAAAQRAENIARYKQLNARPDHQPSGVLQRPGATPRAIPGPRGRALHPDPRGPNTGQP